MDKVDKKVLRAIRQEMNGLSIRDCLVLRFLARIISLIPSFIYPSADPRLSNSPSRTAASALLHDNLMASNILIDRSYRVKGFRHPTAHSRSSLMLKLAQVHQLVRRKTPAHPLRLETTTLPDHRSQPLRRYKFRHQHSADKIDTTPNAPLTR